MEPDTKKADVEVHNADNRSARRSAQHKRGLAGRRARDQPGGRVVDRAAGSQPLHHVLRPPTQTPPSRSASAGSTASSFRFPRCCCVILGRFVLHRFQPEVNLLNLAVPLLFSLMLVRVAVYVLRRAFRADGPLRYWERAIAWTIWVGVALHITGLLPEVVEAARRLRVPGRQTAHLGADHPAGHAVGGDHRGHRAVGGPDDRSAACSMRAAWI